MKYLCLAAAIWSTVFVAVADADSSQTGQSTTTTTTTAAGSTSTTTTTQGGLAAALSQAQIQGQQITNANAAFTGSGIAGTVTPGTGAGTMEANLLTAVAINSAAEEIKTAIGSASGSGLLIITGFGSLDLSQAMLYDDRKTTIGGDSGELTTAIEEYNAAVAPPPAVRQGRNIRADLGLPVADAFGLGLTQAGKALSYLMTNYQISGVSVVTNDNMLAVAIASREPNAIISTQMLNYTQGKQILKDLESMATDVQTATRDIAHGTALLKPKKKPKNADAIQKAIDHLTTAVADYGAFQTWLLGGISGTTMIQGSLPTVMQQEAAITLLQNNGTVLFIQIDNAAGGFVTKQNLWTEFGAMPFYAAAGVVVSYALYGKPATPKGTPAAAAIQALLDPKYNWSFLTGGLFGVVTPYRKVGHVPLIVRLDKNGSCDAVSDLYAPGEAKPATGPTGRMGTYCPR